MYVLVAALASGGCAREDGGIHSEDTEDTERIGGREDRIEPPRSRRTPRGRGWPLDRGNHGGRRRSREQQRTRGFEMRSLARIGLGVLDSVFGAVSLALIVACRGGHARHPWDVGRAEQHGTAHDVAAHDVAAHDKESRDA